jgi:hypothetical protein
MVHGIGDIALGFQIHNKRRAITGVKALADQAGVTNNDAHPAQRSRAGGEFISRR